jgi:hypothetical protein
MLLIKKCVFIIFASSHMMPDLLTFNILIFLRFLKLTKSSVLSHAHEFRTLFLMKHGRNFCLIASIIYAIVPRKRFVV